MPLFFGNVEVDQHNGNINYLGQEVEKVVYKSNGIEEVVWEKIKEQDITPGTGAFPYCYSLNPGSYALSYQVNDNISASGKQSYAIQYVDGVYKVTRGSNLNETFLGAPQDDQYVNSYGHLWMGGLNNGTYTRDSEGKCYVMTATGSFSRQGYSKIKFKIYSNTWWHKADNRIIIDDQVTWDKLSSISLNESDYSINKGYLSHFAWVVPESNDDTYWNYGYSPTGVFLGTDQTRYTAPGGSGILHTEFDLNLNTFFPNSNNINIINALLDPSSHYDDPNWKSHKSVAFDLNSTIHLYN